MPKQIFRLFGIIVEYEYLRDELKPRGFPMNKFMWIHRGFMIRILWRQIYVFRHEAPEKVKADMEALFNKYK